MTDDLSEHITEVVEQYAAQNPFGITGPDEELAIAGRTIAYVAMFDAQGNEIVRVDVASFVAYKGELVFSDLKIRVI